MSQFNETSKYKNYLGILALLLVIITIVSVLSNWDITRYQEGFMWIFTSLIASLVASNILEQLNIPYLKKIVLNMNIKGFKFSIPLFMLTVIVLKLLIF
jgi:hypothetical protein